MIFVPRVMDRAASALKIQMSFRSYLKRKRQRDQAHSTIVPANEYFMAEAII